MWQLRPVRPAAAAGALSVIALSGCTPPFSLGLPTTRALESGAADTLSAANSFEITGSYREAGARWSIDLQVTRPDRVHAVVSSANETLEAVAIGDDAYFRGQPFLAAHLGNDPLSRNLARAAGSSWWKGSAGHVPQLTDFTDGSVFRSTFLGPAVTQRTDHQSVGGLDAVDLSGPRADVFVAATPPYAVLRVHLKHGVVIDGITDGDLRFDHVDKDFQIAAPGDVIDFSNLTTLPPIYTVVSVDTSACGSPCTVSARLKNLGGMHGARGPSSVTFSMTDTASKQVIGRCQAPVEPDVGYNATTTVACTIVDLVQPHGNAATVTGTADNPGRA